jgi:hypothetical protein
MRTPHVITRFRAWVARNYGPRIPDVVVADDLADPIIGMLANMINKLEKRF